MTEKDPNKPSEDEAATDAEGAPLTDDELESAAGGTRLRINKTASPMVSPNAVMMEAAEIDELSGSQLVNRGLKK